MNNGISAWLRCYRCWSRNLEVQVHYDAIRTIDPETGLPAEGVDEIQESVVQCLDCMHDQPHLTFDRDRVVPIEDRWERLVAGTPWVASCTVTVEGDQVEACSGPEAVDFLWPENRVVVETDGYAFHADRPAFEADHERTAELQEAGYRVLRATWQMLDRNPGRFMRLLDRTRDERITFAM